MAEFYGVTLILQEDNGVWLISSPLSGNEWTFPGLQWLKAPVEENKLHEKFGRVLNDDVNELTDNGLMRVHLPKLFNFSNYKVIGKIVDQTFNHDIAVVQVQAESTKKEKDFTMLERGNTRYRFFNVEELKKQMDTLDPSHYEREVYKIALKTINCLSDSPNISVRY
jgi:hypothetical protein